MVFVLTSSLGSAGFAGGVGVNLRWAALLILKNLFDR